MMLAVDVDYCKTEAMVAGVCFADWEDESPLHIVKSKLGDIEAYEPGVFYKRELPCIIKLIEEHALTPELIVDGYVVLGSEAKSGLGMYLYNALQCRIPIVGVAKRRFKDTAHTAEVLRGQSKNPLYVTAIGVDEQVVKTAVKAMHGEHRMPTLLKLVDSECRKS